jgi:predicted deacylase
MTIRKKILHGVEYFQKGELPQWLIIAGQHGDESGVIHSLRTYLEVAGDRLPDFLCMPVISPSALQAGTRLNAYGHDTNRVFTRHSSDPEVQAAIQIIHGQHFALVLSFHEDPDQEAFYLYDSEVIAPPHLATFRQALRARAPEEESRQQQKLGKARNSGPRRFRRILFRLNFLGGLIQNSQGASPLPFRR